MTAARWLALLFVGLLWMPSVTAHSGEAVMGDALECRVLELIAGGGLRLNVGGATRTIKLRGVVIPAETVSGVNALLERLRRQVTSARCTMAADAEVGEAPASVEYLAWRDKSGDVWEDLAATLLQEGLALIASEGAPQGRDYLAREREARQARRGLWAKRNDLGIR